MIHPYLTYKSSFTLKNIDLTKKKKVDQIQDNGENTSKKKPAILEQNKIPSNVQLIEQLKQFGGKIHEKTLHSEKQIELPEIDSEYIGDFLLFVGIFVLDN